MKDRFGLRELPKDIRDVQFGKLVVLPKDIPASFSLPYLTIKHQGDSDYCSQYAACLASEYQEKIDLIPEYTFAYAKQDNPEEWGDDLRSACKAQQKWGAIDVDRFDINTVPAHARRYFNSYPTELYENASSHAKKAYVRLNSFDEIIKTIYKENRAVLMGVIWSWDLKKYKLDTSTQNGYGHAVCAIGWRTIRGARYLEIQNSYGKEAGKDGKHLIRDDIVDSFVNRFGAFCFIDMEPEEAKELHKRAVWTLSTWYERITITLKTFWLNIWT